MYLSDPLDGAGINAKPFGYLADLLRAPWLVQKSHG
jgi:hypothetical protein